MLAAALAATLLAVLASSTGNVAQADVRTAHASLVSENASFSTPGTVDGRVEAIAIDGDTVFVGGTFTQIETPRGAEIIDQAYLFAYSKSTGEVIRDFDPILNRPVRALHTTGEGTGVFAGGNFTVVNGETNRKGLVKLDDFGDRVQSFSARIDKRVYAMDRSGDTLYIAGNFERVNQTPVEYLAAIDTATGELLPNIDLDFDGVYSTTRNMGFGSIDAVEVTSDDQRMLIIGNFRTIDGLRRPRIAVLELGTQAVVSDWNTNVFEVDCPSQRDPQYIEGIDISPDDSYFVTGTTGAGRIGDPACDTVLRFDFGDLSDSDAQPTWIAYTGGDTVYEVAATEHAIYTGGHFRWFNNGHARDRVGPGSVERRGLAALDPLNGLPLVNWRADRNPRGVGVFALEVQPEGLYIGDDTEFLNNFSHPQFKFLPITSNRIARPGAASLPTSIFAVSGSTLDAVPFDGTTLGASAPMSSADWGSSRGAMFLGGKLFHADDSGVMWVSSLRDDDTLGPRTQVDLFGLTSAEWDLARLGGMFFDHEQGRVYYARDNDSRLFWRAFTPDGAIFGDIENVARDQGDILWNDVRGMDVIDGHLYFGRTDGNLYRATVNGSSPVPGTTEAVSGPGNGDRDWSMPFLAFSSEGMLLPPPSQAQSEFEAAGSADFKSFRTFDFPVAAGEPVDVRLTWDDPNAQLNVFLRDQNGQLVDSDNDVNGSSPKWVSAPAGDGGTYTVAVKIQSGSTAYTVSINPAEQPPVPLADFAFSASGSATGTGRWQVFKFDVEVGDPVEAQVVWDDPSAAVSVFLRDENRNAVDVDNDGSGSPETVSAVADTAGRWSVAVRIQSGSIDYDVLVNTTMATP